MRKPAYIMDRWAGSSINLLTGSSTVLLNGTRTWKRSKHGLQIADGITVSDENTGKNYEAFCIAGDRLATNFCLCVDQVDCALFSKGNDGSGTWRQYVEAQGERLLFGPNRTRGSAEDITGALDALYEGATAEADYLSNAQFDR